jgi:hypothetical protein
MKKDLFIETIEVIKAQREHDLKCVRAFEIILPNTFIIGYDNTKLEDQLIKLLRVAMNVDTKDIIIDYFIDDLEFGTKYKKGCIYENGIDIDISSSAKLYDYLKKTYE